MTTALLRPGSRLILLLASSFIFLLVDASHADPAGTLLFIGRRCTACGDEIHAINADGTDVVRMTRGRLWDSSPVWSPDGSKIAFVGAGENGIWMIEADGVNLAEDGIPAVEDGGVLVIDDRRTTTTMISSVDALALSWSPDGTKLAYQGYGEDLDTNDDDDVLNFNFDVFVMDVDGTNLVNLTDHPAWDQSPCWSPDGRSIAFRSLREGNGDIYVMNADGTDAVNLTRSDVFDGHPSWSPDGTRIAFASSPLTSYGDVYVMDADGSNPVNLTNHPGREVGRAFSDKPTWSPDGTKLAYSAVRDGIWTIFIMNADGSEQTRLLPGWGFNPVWSPAQRATATAVETMSWGRLKRGAP